jgi:hypothetical protein
VQGGWGGYEGGAIFVFGNATVSNCTFYKNTAPVGIARVCGVDQGGRTADTAQIFSPGIKDSFGSGFISTAITVQNY